MATTTRVKLSKVHKELADLKRFAISIVSQIQDFEDSQSQFQEVAAVDVENLLSDICSDAESLLKKANTYIEPYCKI